MNIKWNTVTWYSKLLAVFFFIGIIPAWTFYIGMQYQETKEAMVLPNLQSFSDTSVVKQKNEIVFLHRDSDILSLYVINVDGSNKRLVYRNRDNVNSNILAPKWSAGNTILFGAMKDGNWKIFSIKSDGTNLKVDSNLDMSMSDFAVSQESRDKNLIVEELDDQKEYRLSRVEGDAKTKIYSVGYSKCGASCPPGGLIHEASFSPDKKSVIFEQGKDIMIASADGKDLKVLTEGESPDWH